MSTKIKILCLLIPAFLAITFLVVSKNIFVINLDTTIHTSIENHQYPVVSNLMVSATRLGDVFEASVIFIIFGLFLISRHRKYFYVFTLSVFLGALLPQIIKFLATIQRPTNLLMENDYSFPSGHATIATVFLLSSLFLLIPLIKNKFSQKIFLLITSGLFPLVALSRIYLSVHWTSDVIAGIILGTICFVFAEIACCQKKENVL